MGRKLNPIEAASSAFPDVDATQGLPTPSWNQQLQQRIAQQLGISPAALDPASTLRADAQSVEGSVGTFDVALGRECLDLLEAYCRISDPDRRLRCLQIVREAASTADSDEHAS